MWGVGQSGSNGTHSNTKSSELHVNYGVVAGQVNAARDGILYQGTSITVNSIGSQNIVSTKIIGDGNKLDINADQNSKNTGDVNNSALLNILLGGH